MGEGQSGQAIKLIQITPYVMIFKHLNSYRENYLRKFRLILTDNTKYVYVKTKLHAGITFIVDF